MKKRFYNYTNIKEIKIKIILKLIFIDYNLKF